MVPVGKKTIIITTECVSPLLQSNQNESKYQNNNDTTNIENIVHDDLEIISSSHSMKTSSLPSCLTPEISNSSNSNNDFNTSKITCIGINKYFNRLVKYRGYFLGILAAFFLSFSKVILKKSPLLSGSDHSLIRYVLQFVFLFVIIKYKRLSLFGPNDITVKKILRLRGFIGAIGMIFLHFAITMIAPSDNVAVTHSSVIITAILARIFLKERFTIAHIFSLILTVIGILLISQPSFLFKTKSIQTNLMVKNDTQNSTSLIYSLNDQNYSLYIGIFLTLCGALTTAIVQITIKHLCNKKVHYSVIIIYSSYLGIPISSAISITLYVTGVSYKNSASLESIMVQIFYSFLSAVVGLSAQICLSLSLKYEEASRISIIKTTDLIFTFIFQSYLVNIVKDYLSSVGAYLILLGAFLIFVSKFIENKLNRTSSKGNNLTTNSEISSNGENAYTNKHPDSILNSNDTYLKLFKMFLFFKF